MSDEDVVDVLIDPEEEAQQFKAVPVKLSEEGEKRFLMMQESYRNADHLEWKRRENLKMDSYEVHIKTTNRFNLINSLVSFAGISALIVIVARLV